MSRNSSKFNLTGNPSPNAKNAWGTPTGTARLSKKGRYPLGFSRQPMKNISRKPNFLRISGIFFSQKYPRRQKFLWKFSRKQKLSRKSPRRQKIQRKFSRKWNFWVNFLENENFRITFLENENLCVNVLENENFA